MTASVAWLFACLAGSLTRSQPLAILTRQVLEIHDGRAALRYSSWVKNPTDHKVTIQASDVPSLNLPDKPHTLYAIEGVLNWTASKGGLTNGGRNALVRYDTGDGWFMIPENNWATCLEPGGTKAHSKDKAPSRLESHLTKLTNRSLQIDPI